MNRWIRSVALFVAVVCLTAAATQANEIAIDNVREGDLIVKGFEMSRPGDVTVKALGMRSPFSRQLTVYAWILNAETREPVWRMTFSRTNATDRDRIMRTVEQQVMLDAGKYELYLYASDFNDWNGMFNNNKDLWDLLSDVLNDEDEDYSSEYDDANISDCYVKVSCADNLAPYEVTAGLQGALVSFTGLGDEEYVRQSFKLDEAMNIKIYALSEQPRGYKHFVDGGWIIDARTRQPVWEMDRFNTERAGGGRKNRVFQDEIRLEPGEYTLYYSTDDSHSADQFNVNPPVDPLNYGITLLPGRDFKASAFHLVAASEQEQPLIDFSRARNDEYLEETFEITRPCEVRVYALGEMGNYGGFADYGWIVDLKNGQVVWEMTDNNTTHAGGADKNRAFDGLVKLDKGTYRVTYVTDDSHAYRRWNSNKPYDPRAWGLQIFPSLDYKDGTLKVVNASAATAGADGLPVFMTRVSNNVRRHTMFSLKDATELHIKALGEAESRRFYDYAWIENADNGRVVWEMTDRNTEWAGGADKNRKFDGTIMLEPGVYNVYYESDDSHAFGNWNADPPRDQSSWGITITKD